ncbi:hypothetical protein [Streptomyces sp. JB150]|uniref:hypothetical protein n=1 Tax=Streptomyces sp. JB150 TaxID=2714844 RepID=UPI00140D0100|nr:hypothetical protein [Streptomyces sp. JB150]QIJ65672.1 hypothetical protein G7Z13_29345 [Streptomyces sp. JB150]
MTAEPTDGGPERVQPGQAAKEQTSAVTGQAGQAAGQVGSTALEQARTVTGEARRQTESAVSDLRERVTQEMEEQTRRAAGTVRQWADDLAALADNAPGESPARSLVTQVADGGHRAAEYLDQHGVAGMTENLKGFARRRPGAFLAGAALAGLAVGRMGKAGGKARSAQQQPSAAGPGDATPPPPPPQLPEGAAPPVPPVYPGV